MGLNGSTLRLAIVAEQFSLEGGGAERNAAEVARYLASRGHQVTILAGHCGDEVELPGVRIERSRCGKPHGAWRLLCFSRWVRRRLAADGYDASLSITAAAPATIVQPLAGIIRELHERSVAMRPDAVRRLGKRVLLLLNPKQQVLRWLERRTLADPAVRCVVAISPYMADQLSRHYPAAAQHVELVRNAVEMPAVRTAQRKQWRARFRKHLNVPEQATLFLFPAMDPKRKGLVPLLHACQKLAGRGMAFVLVVAGPSAFAHHKLAVRLGIRSHVRFVGQTTHMLPLLCAADVMAMPTFYDPASRVVIESMVMGLPAISTVFDGSSAFMRREDGRVAGRIIEDPHDIEALAAAMAELTDPQQRQQAIEATRGLGEGLSMARHAAELEQLLLRFAGDRTDRSGS